MKVEFPEENSTECAHSEHST